ncbi:MAG: phage holin family protein, partial [Cytophagaceae bacterium]|nr:phage holin family protein [Cytophagaceae bacterium]
FSLVITVAMVYIVEAYVTGFKVNGFIAPLIFSFVVGITNSFVGLFTK